MQPIQAQAEGDIPTEQSRFKRLIIAWQDLEDARQSVSRLLGLNGKAALGRDDAHIQQALVTGAVVAYGRLLRRTRPSASVPGHLPERFVAELTPEQQALHRRLLKLRDQEFAHSDAAVADVKITAVPNTFGGFLRPEARILRKYSVTDADLATLEGILSEVHAYLYDEMMRLYPILAPHGDF